MDSMMMTTTRDQRNSTRIAVPLCLRKVSAARCDHAQLLIQNYANFKRSAELARCMFYENGSWVDYENEVAEVLKLGFAERRPVVEVEFGGCVRVFDFHRMIEIELESGYQRSVSWIDVNGKCFFPKAFFSTFGQKDDKNDDDDANDYESFPKIEIEVKISPDSGSSEGLEVNKTVKLCKRKREENLRKEREEEEGNSSTNNGGKRRHMVGSETQSARWLRARVLGAEEKEHGVVKKLFLSGLEGLEQGINVTAIHQYDRSGSLDRARCQIFAKQMEIMKRVRGKSNMVFAWYGTSAKGVESILTHGFGMPSQVSSCGRPGVGIHLSPARSPLNSAMLSEIDENGEKHVMLCRVILGRCEKVEVGSAQSRPSSLDYDTGVDDLMNPKWYTIWHANMNTHILPECVVSFKPVKVPVPAEGVADTNRVTHPSVLGTELIAKLKCCLPPSKIQELGTLFRMHKEGKLVKDVFMKQLRLVVGDDVLHSTIQKICG